ncbi:MAG TPA: hypothetical protein VME45_12570 [Stellaceae bacterium]|nr:hypothetical protein [Stellaceae bacterium]
MAIDVLERPPGGPTPRRPQFRLSHDEDGWTLLQPDGRTRRFDTFEAGIEGAREAAPAPKTPIDVWENGQYICCLPPEQWVRPAHPAATGAEPLFPSTERHADRASGGLMRAAGTFFWLALLGVALIASLGWRLALL